MLRNKRPNPVIKAIVQGLIKYKAFIFCHIKPMKSVSIFSEYYMICMLKLVAYTLHLCYNNVISGMNDELQKP